MRKVRTMATGCLSVILLLAPALYAQGILGTWQATLPVDNSPHVQLRITQASDGALRGVFDRFDWTTSVPLSTITFLAPDLNAAAPVIDIAFHARLGPDGKSLQGTWQQAKHSYPLTFTLATPETLWKRDNGAPMALSADPAFEVAVIRPSEPGKTQRSFALRTRHFNARNSTVFQMVKFAYALQSRQIEGAPEWFESVRFDIDAEPDTEGVPNEQQYRLMLRKLLAERFQLRTHILQRVVPVYALTLQNKTPRLDPADDPNGHSHIFVKQIDDGQTLGQFMDFTMPDVADFLMGFLPERQILDETGLKGRVNFTMTIATASTQGPANDTAAEYFHAIEPLGFKLIPRKAPIDILVIDHLEKPSAN
ncbi:soil-associated protein, TIGR03435 family [Granulicella pectinivorans]|uniref:Soil-associated protein, TIGR03435 family n=1 Tax=Granulicella pectinivorans TaxID=474950 RepID=A0A1I6LGW4_9BACT|nr:TIGR03435 family protein [Granulicella pectinivorans]SFS02560.1 soil-associated protein, TIGR03435 family [Granulicella pectinivorans]